jgi:hypothetical protein
MILLEACAHHAPVATVEIIDTSLSIMPRSVLGAVNDQIASLGLGDILIVIPITDDTRNDAGGRILRLQAPGTRESYDANPKRFRADAQKRFTAWAASLDPLQRRTDILGALDAARQEFASIPAADERQLIVASDFLEDDDVHDFVRDRALRNSARARVLAADLRAERGFVLPRAVLCLGRIESREFATLTEERKAAVQAFCVEHLSDNGKAPELHIDGTGLLSGTGGCPSDTQSA